MQFVHLRRKWGELRSMTRVRPSFPFCFVGEQHDRQSTCLHLCVHLPANHFSLSSTFCKKADRLTQVASLDLAIRFGLNSAHTRPSNHTQPPHRQTNVPAYRPSSASYLFFVPLSIAIHIAYMHTLTHIHMIHFVQISSFALRGSCVLLSEDARARTLSRSPIRTTPK